MRLNILNSLMGLCVATAAVSCSDGLVEDNLRPVGGESDMISFVVAENNNATRGGSFGNRPCGGAILRSANGADSLYLKMEVADIIDAPSSRAVDISSTNLPTELYMSCLIRTIENKYLYYFDDEIFEKDGNIWKSKTPHYWLNNNTHYKFYGYYASKDAKDNEWVKYIDGDSNNSFVPSLEYTVQTDPKKQFDLTYYYPSISEPGVKDETYNIEFIATSAHNMDVPLAMKHALSKICFKTGTIASTITGIEIRNIYTKGKLNLGTGDWSELAEKNNVKLSGIKVSDNDQPITPEDNSFMLLPKSILDDSELAVYIEGETEPYTASLKECVWEAGKQYTYTININSGLEVEILPEYKTVDAHYVIAKAKVKVPENDPNMAWKLEVSSSNSNSDLQPSIIRKDHPSYKKYNDLFEAGYWLDTEYNKDKTARGTIKDEGKGTQDLYVFIPENISPTEVQTIDIKNSETGVVLATIIQLHPSWSTVNPNFGVERFQDNKTYPWGFKWDKDTKVTYKMPSNGVAAFTHLLFEIFRGENYPYVHDEGFALFGNWKITVDFSDLDTFSEATSTNNGLDNSWDMYNFKGISQAKDFMDRVEHNWGGVPDKELPSNPADYAALACLKKNRFEVEAVEQSGQTEYFARLKEKDLKWYLASKEEAPFMSDNEYDKIEGVYWTSTSISDPGTTAYKFTAGETTSSEDRDIKYHVRACRDLTKSR